MDAKKRKEQAETKEQEIGLSPSDQATLAEYFKTWNATDAWARTHPNCTRESAMRLGSRWLRKVEVQSELKAYFESLQMESFEVLGRLAEQARASHAPFIEVTDDGFVYFDFSSDEAKNHLHLIKKIKTKRQRLVEGKGEDAETWEHEWVEVELHDPQKALELIGKHKKLFSEQLEISNPDGSLKPQISDEERLSRMKALALMIAQEVKNA